MISDTQLGLAWEPGNDKQTVYLVFVIKTRHKSVSRGYSKTTQKEMSKLFSCDYLTIHQNGLFHFLSSDDQIGFNECVQERMIVWLITPLELNLRRFDPSEEKWYLKKSHNWYERFIFVYRPLEILSENVINTLDWNLRRFDPLKKMRL